MKVRFVLVVLSIFCLCRLAEAQELTLFRYVDQSAVVLSLKEKTVLAAIEARPASKSVSLVQIENLASLSTTHALTLRLPQRDPLTVYRAYVETSSESTFGWLGTNSDKLASALFTVTARSISGIIHIGGSLFALEPLGGPHNALVEVDPSKFPADDAPRGLPKGLQEDIQAGRKSDRHALSSRLDRKTSLLTAGPVVDVFVAYTPAVANYTGDISNLIAQCVLTTDPICEQSGVSARISSASVIWTAAEPFGLRG